jgi:hypothetical protein
LVTLTSIANVRIQLLCLGEVGGASDEIAFGSLCEAPVKDGNRVIWADPNGLVVVLNGVVELALAKVGIAPTVEGVCVTPSDPNGAVELLNSAVELAAAKID